MTMHVRMLLPSDTEAHPPAHPLTGPCDLELGLEVGFALDSRHSLLPRPLGAESLGTPLQSLD